MFDAPCNVDAVDISPGKIKRAFLDVRPVAGEVERELVVVADGDE